VTQKAFDGNLAHTSAQFQHQVEAFSRRVLDAVEGAQTTVTVGDFADMLNAFADALNSPELPEPTTLLHALARLNNARALKDALALYASWFSAGDEDAHKSARARSIERLSSRTLFGPRELAHGARVELECTVDASFARLQEARAVLSRRRTRLKRAAVGAAATVVVLPMVAPWAVSSIVSTAVGSGVTAVRTAVLASASVAGAAQESNAALGLALLAASACAVIAFRLVTVNWSRPRRWARAHF